MPGNNAFLVVSIGGGGDDDDDESIFVAPSASVMGGTGPVVEDGCCRKVSATLGGIPMVKPKDECDIFNLGNNFLMEANEHRCGIAEVKILCFSFGLSPVGNTCDLTIVG